jgi:hypothetical protein
VALLTKGVNSPYKIRVIQAPEGHEHAGQRAAVFLAEGTDDERQKWLQSMDLGDYEVMLIGVDSPDATSRTSD